MKFCGQAEPGEWGDLTQREKEMCILRVLHNLTYEELSGQLHVTRSDVAYHLRTAMRILRVSGSLRLAFWMGRHADEIFGTEEQGS